jgi:translation initiation factor IF-3
MKEIKMRPNIGEHDYNFKIKSLCKFLKDGNQVKITIMFKGREMNYIDLGTKIRRSKYGFSFNTQIIKY